MLVFAAIGVFGAGMLAIAAGIPIKDFGFGNTLILSGVLAWCTSVMMISIWVCARDLRQVLEQDDRPARKRRRQLSGASHSPASGDNSGWPETIPEKSAPSSPPAPSPPPGDAKPPRRNLLFSSSRRQASQAESRSKWPSRTPPAEMPAPEPRAPQLAEDRVPPRRAVPNCRRAPARPPLSLGAAREPARRPRRRAAACRRRASRLPLRPIAARRAFAAAPRTASPSAPPAPPPRRARPQRQRRGFAC